MNIVYIVKVERMGYIVNNMQRLLMEIKGIELQQSELIVYLEENGLQPFDTYNTNDNSNKRSVYMTALHVLESLANNPTMMSTMKIDDMTVSDFHENLMARIDQLERRVRKMTVSNTDSTSFLLYG